MAQQPNEGNTIKAISKACVHRICSGQVVLTLATAVKELVENSLDAGATIIEVKLKEYGSELLEVVDNGNGVKLEDFESLTLKHHTSKLEEFSDLSTVETFGFRGEALSSLCALSDLTVVTCHKEASIGTKLEYDHNGNLIKSSPSPRQVGTTVNLQNLFSTLPVRQKEFIRNLRREFGKMVNLLTAYCLVCTNKRITCVNHTGKGKKTTVLSTPASNNMKENISCVFGVKQVNSLLQITQVPPSESVLEEFYISGSYQETPNIFRIEGYVSSCVHGEGRSSTDRQYFFINGRPCDLPKVAKVVNEIYHSYNRHQYPFILLNVCLEKDSVDINVTPDKRQIFVQREKLLLATIKSSMLHIYEHKPSVMEYHPLGIMRENIKSGLMSNFENTSTGGITKSLSFPNLKRSLHEESHTAEDISEDFKNPHLSCQSDIDRSTKDDSVDFIQTFKMEKELNGVNMETRIISKESCSSKAPFASNDLKTVTDEDQQNVQIVLQKRTLENSIKDTSERASEYSNISSQSLNKKLKSTSDGVCYTLTRPFRDDKVVNKIIRRDSCPLGTNAYSSILKFARTSPRNSTMVKEGSLGQSGGSSGLKHTTEELMNQLQAGPAELCLNEMTGKAFAKTCISIPSENIPDVDAGECIQKSNSMNAESGQEMIDLTVTPLTTSKRTSEVKIEITTDKPVTLSRKTKYCNFSMDSIKQKLFNKAKLDSKILHTHRKFRSKIVASENHNAEEELSKEISKDTFSQMEIIGQFNLGFIITKLKDDLFIIDQHATDEKYNFEILQRDTTLETQKLLQPQTLELTAVSESILLDNIHIFEKNGFKFNILGDDKPGQRVQLVSMPVSHNWSFGKEDIDELIFMLSDNPGRMCRPSRVSQMFASRSCRKSVMIGTALSVPDMKKLVCHMGEIEQPWNCPHGRPTIRHLFNMNMLPSL